MKGGEGAPWSPDTGVIFSCRSLSASQWERRFSTAAGHACLRGSLRLCWQPPSGAMESFRVSYLVRRGLTVLSGEQKHNFRSCQTAILNGTLTAQRGAATQSSYSTALRIDMLATAEWTPQRHRHNGKKMLVGKTFGSRVHCCCGHFFVFKENRSRQSQI